MKRLVLALSLISAPAFAVKVKDCPSRIEVKIEGISVYDIEKLDLSNLTSEEDEAAVKKLLEYLSDYGSDFVFKTQLGLAKKENAQCRYGGYELEGSYTNPRAKFFTRNGVNWLRFAFVFEGKDLGVYLKVSEYSPEAIKLEKGKMVVKLSSDDHHGEFSGTVDLGLIKAASVDVLD